MYESKALKKGFQGFVQKSWSSCSAVHCPIELPAAAIPDFEAVWRCYVDTGIAKRTLKCGNKVN